MPTYSDAISNNDFTTPQKPTPKLNRPKKLKEFWDVEPGDPGTEGWSDNPNDPTGAQLGVGDANANVVVTPDKATQTVPNPKWTEYLQFTDAVTSNESKNTGAFINRIKDLESKGCKIERLLTAAIGINAEGGEFLEIVKKIAFQGKEFTPAEKEHLLIELGDVLWYVAQATIALDLSLDEVIGRNISKLAKRYPEGHFNAYFSENRRIDDL